MTTGSTIKSSRGISLGQRRANDAWSCVRAACNDFDDKSLKDYAGEAKKLPIRIKASGLGQALAFVASKAKKSQKSGPALSQLLKDLSEWVLHKRGLAATWKPGDPEFPDATPTELLPAIVQGNSSFLRWSTDEVMTYLEWLNRFLEANVDVDPTGID